jgi:predicted DCC family thiol-disulfide oxidoreductase YuxK
MRLLPRGFRDLVYDLVARMRYRTFGRYDVCPIPPPAVRDRFLDL